MIWNFFAFFQNLFFQIFLWILMILFERSGTASITMFFERISFNNMFFFLFIFQIWIFLFFFFIRNKSIANILKNFFLSFLLFPKHILQFPSFFLFFIFFSEFFFPLNFFKSFYLQFFVNVLGEYTAIPSFFIFLSLFQIFFPKKKEITFLTSSYELLLFWFFLFLISISLLPKLKKNYSDLERFPTLGPILSNVIYFSVLFFNYYS